MEQDELRKGADKVINVTYMLSGVLEQSFQEMDDILERLHKRLHHEDRRLILFESTLGSLTQILNPLEPILWLRWMRKL